MCAMCKGKHQFTLKNNWNVTLSGLTKKGKTLEVAHMKYENLSNNVFQEVDGFLRALEEVAQIIVRVRKLPFVPVTLTNRVI